MLVDPRSQGDEKGFNPNVDNVVKPARASGGAKIFYWFFVILFSFTIVGFIVWFFWVNKIKNRFNNLQNEINQSSSTIDVTLKKRKDALTKLLNSTQGYLKHEKGTLENITKMRSLNTEGMDNHENAQRTMDSVQNAFRINVENYPELKANTVVIDLMTSAETIEDEIAASRRLYNAKITQFNSMLFAFPTNIIASGLKMWSLPLFIASESDKKDVDFGSLAQ